MEFSKGDNNIKNIEIAQNPKSTISMLNRSMSCQSSPAFEVSKKPFDRTNSVKNLNSSHESIIRGKVKKLCSIFEKKKGKFLPGTEERVVVYFTSLRGVRRTFLDCSYVIMIFKGFRIELDERDVSMHIAYKKELLNVLGEKNVTLPQVFIKGKYIGGVDLIRQLHENGELVEMVKGIRVKAVMKACDECGDVRFVACVNCNGSRKVYDEDDDRVRRCPDCNENGIVRCPICNVC